MLRAWQRLLILEILSLHMASSMIADDMGCPKVELAGLGRMAIDGAMMETRAGTGLTDSSSSV